MGLEQQKQKTLRSAEGLLRQGKIQEALVVLERMAASAASDQLTLNRMGDLLARFGRNEEAVSYYFRIAVEFANSGFYPKAVAIHKKILRLHPDNIDSLVHLGELYLERRLPADARAHLLRAAELQLQAKNFEAARAVYQKLVEAEPEDARHRVRLAEAIAAEGDDGQAGDELLRLAQSLLKAGNFTDAEKSYRRASELLPGRSEPLIGICDCLVGQGQDQEALQTLEKAAAAEDASADVKAALALRYEASGNLDKTVSLLQSLELSDVPAATLQSLFRINLDAERVDSCWERFDPLFEQWAKDSDSGKLAEMYRQISLIEKPGHLPAIERWRDLMHASDDSKGESRAIEALVLAYQARSMSAEAELALAKLKELAPNSALFGKRQPAKSEQPSAPPAAPSIAAESTEETDGDLPLAVEAPAVPVNRADEEFTTGRLTQAEILDKYGLHDQALQQVREVIDRFPGSVDAQEKLVLFLRTVNDREQLRDALVGLALARKAVGDLDQAKAAAAEARRNGPLDETTSKQLDKLGLLADPEPEPPAEEPKKFEQSEKASAAEDDDDRVVLIDFDGEDDGEDSEEVTDAELPMPLPAVAPPVAATPPRPVENPVQQAAPAEPPAEPVQTAAPASPPAAQEAAAAPSGELIGDDLSAITAALESDVFADEDQAGAGAAESEQSIEEVFASFREHVAEEVDSKDFRTHYDLGIAYKEMGFLDDAVTEFEQAAASPELGREVSIMLAICFREKGETNRAIACYRQAIDLPGADAAAMNGLRYELAELLAENGDKSAALDLLRNVHKDDPSFRDVGARIEKLEAEPVG